MEPPEIWSVSGCVSLCVCLLLPHQIGNAGLNFKCQALGRLCWVEPWILISFQKKMEAAWCFFGKKAKLGVVMDRKTLNNGWGELLMNHLQGLVQDSHWLSVNLTFSFLLWHIAHSMQRFLCFLKCPLQCCCREHLGEPCWLSKRLCRSNDWRTGGGMTEKDLEGVASCGRFGD